MDHDRAPGGVTLADIEVLVVEDEYHLAFELKSLVENAGGRVAGPFADAAEAISHLGRHRPDCGIIDVNLANGVSFVAADALVDHAVPFLFLTGYDATALPDRFAGIDRVEKPADLGRVLRKLAVLGAPR